MIICSDKNTLKLWCGYKKGKQIHKILIHFIQISLFSFLKLIVFCYDCRITNFFFIMH